jgi:cytochrome c oxidase assembly protein subunit 15
VRLSLGLVAGVIGQIVLGGLAVEFDLRPPFVMGHFLLSQVLVWNAVVLHRRAAQPEGPVQPVVDPMAARFGRLVVAAAAVVLVLGTVVTAAGPHGGDERAVRLDVGLHEAARVHGLAVWLFLAIVLVGLGLLWRTGAPYDVIRRGEILLATIVAQAAIGYAQYFTGVPALLVGIHLAGATAVWVAVLHFHLGLFERRPPAGGRTPTPAEAPAAVLVPAGDLRP